jgi:adenosylmethionine-8-amino-7-oxononanoate aminotransferase
MVPKDPQTGARLTSGVLHRSLNKAYPVASRGEGVYLWDADDKRYLDFSGSAAVNFIGHGSPEVADAIAEQAAKFEFVHSSQFTTDVAERFAEELLQFAGPSFFGGRVFFTCGGSEAVETALKLARQYQVETGKPEKFRIVSRTQSYHGATLGALAASGNRRRREIFLPMVKVPEAFLHVGLPYCYRCAYKCDGSGKCAENYAKELEIAIEESRGTVAAFIAEPVSGATLGAAVPPNGYLKRVRQICLENEALFIADEVMTGCGRTGRNFAVEHWGVSPDIMVLAKGLSSGYLPLGAVIASKQVVNVLEEGSGQFTHGFTYNAHPLSMAAGRAVLQQMYLMQLVSAANSDSPNSVGAAIGLELEKLRDCNSVGDVRGIGLLRGIEFVADKVTKAPYPAELNFAGEVAEASARRGVMVYPMQGCVDGTLGDHLLIAPPAVIKRDQIAMACAALTEAIVEVETEIKVNS